jgi:protein-tyrosine phosphatase
MRPEVYWLNAPACGRLAIMPRPRAGDWLDEEIAGWRAEGIHVVVSLLEAEEVAELGLQREAGLCREHGIEFISFPLPDRGVPATVREARAFAEGIIARLKDGKGVALHCRAGIGRSALMGACALVLLGMAPGAAFDLIGKARGAEVPDTKQQREWVATFREAATSD